MSQQEQQIDMTADIDLEKETVGEGAIKLLTFIMDNDIYAFDIMGIKEIIEYGTVTRVPMSPAYIRGVINLRGNVVPVIDLAGRVGKSTSKVTKRTCIVVFEIACDDEKMDIGVAIDSVNNVVSASVDDVEGPPSFGTGIRAVFIDGMVKVNDKFVIVLNLEKVLSIEELALLEKVVMKDDKVEDV